MDCIFIEVLNNNEHPLLCSNEQAAVLSFIREAEVECKTRGHTCKGFAALAYLGWDYIVLSYEEARATYGDDWLAIMERIN